MAEMMDKDFTYEELYTLKTIFESHIETPGMEELVLEMQ